MSSIIFKTNNPLELKQGTGFILTKKKLFIRLIMTRSNFYALCSTYNIDVNIALENDDLIELLKSKASYETIEKFLQEQF